MRKQLAALAAAVTTTASMPAYFNVHSTTFPGGEIRGFLAVPEPQTLALMLVGLAGLGAMSRRRRDTP